MVNGCVYCEYERILNGIAESGWGIVYSGDILEFSRIINIYDFCDFVQTIGALNRLAFTVTLYEIDHIL